MFFLVAARHGTPQGEPGSANDTAKKPDGPIIGSARFFQAHRLRSMRLGRRLRSPVPELREPRGNTRLTSADDSGKNILAAAEQRPDLVGLGVRLHPILENSTVCTFIV